ncbi:MAG: hypothetical protein IH595_11050 [Bacteroidales bacterium]|nr:hypothetical protein [Bacteroidales bacterium]
MRIRIFTTLILILTLTTFANKAEAQYYLNGQDPASVKWRQIDTKHFKLVFPQDYDSVAQHYANLLMLSTPYVAHPYLKQARPLTIILHNLSTQANAMVSPAPYHADIFDIPSQEIYPQLWQKQLVLHEFRHAVQMSKMRQGFGNVLYAVLGEQGTALLMGALPFWFIEGDAVYSETIHSKSGRGRMPDFTYPLEAQVLGKKIYPIDKAQFGSYKDFVPDHYTLGYQLVLNGVQHYGTGLWNGVLNEVARRSYTIFPFTIGLHKATHMGKVKFYHHVMNELKEKWENENAHYQKPDFKTIITKNKFYTNYRFPNVLSNGNIILEKSGPDDINRFVMLTPAGKEIRLFTPGFDYDQSLSSNDSLICWNEMDFDLRWSNRDYSDIKLYNYHTKKLTQLTRKSRYFAPALSPDSKYLVAVKVDDQGHYSLDFFDLRSGKVIKSFHTPDNLFFLTPHWSPDSQHVVVTVLGNHGKALLWLNVNTLKYRLLMPFSYTEMKWPVTYGNWVIYTAGYEDKDNLYAVNINTGKMFRYMDARFGAVDATFSPEGKKVYFANYTADGYKPAFMDFDPSKLVPFNPQKNDIQYPVDKLVNKSTFILDDSVVPGKVYPVKKYSRLGHLFNPYGWGPFSLNLNNYAFSPGVSILSQNNLSTAISSLKYTWDRNQQTGKYSFSFNYYGWYPEIGLNASTQNRRTYLTDSTGVHEVFWNESDLSASLKLPLNLSHGKVVAGLQPSVQYEIRYLTMKPGSHYYFKNPQIANLTYQLYEYSYLKTSPKDIYPKWGQTLQVTFQNTPFISETNDQFAAQAHFYLPGFIRHQGISVYAGYENQETGDYPFSMLVNIPRGYSGLFFHQYFTLQADYAFPIAYPDWDLIQGGFYLKRIYSHLFYDYMNRMPYNEVFSSTGIELYTEWNLLNKFPTATLGVRWNYLQSQKSNTFDLLLGINF